MDRNYGRPPVTTTVKKLRRPPLTTINHKGHPKSQPRSTTTTSVVATFTEHPGERPVFRFGDSRKYSFETEDLLERGRLGVVYRGKATDLEGNIENVAVKVVVGSYDECKLHKMLARFDMLVTLQQENLVTYYQIAVRDSGSGKHSVCSEFVLEISMNYCPDGNLAQLIDHFRRTGRKMPLKMFLDYAQQMAKGLAFLHDRGIIHANVCPSHLLITRPKGNINVLQISAIEEPVTLQRDIINSCSNISEEYAKVNITYVPPEMLTGSNLCPKSNIWAAGCVIQDLAMCCTAERRKMLQFPTRNEKAVRRFDFEKRTQISHARRLLLEGWVPYIGEPIPNDLARRVMEGCFARNPVDRFTTLELSNKLIEIEERTYGTTWNQDVLTTDIELSVSERQTHRLDNENIGVTCRYEYNWKDDIIGQGGFATVYRASVTERGTYTGNVVVAVKEIILSVDCVRKWKKDGSCAKIKEQWRSLLEIHHDHSVRYHKITIKRLLGGTSVSFLMDYCEGGSLYDKIKDICSKSNRAFAFELFSRYAVQITTGLRYLHQKGFIHGDLKPSNILLTSKPDGQERALIADFDGSVRLDQGTTAGSRECKVRHWTVPYMSPEIVTAVLGERHLPVTYSTDVWSLGCVLLDLADCCYGIKERFYQRNPLNNGVNDSVNNKIRRERYDSFAFLFKLSQGYTIYISKLIPQTLADVIKPCFDCDPSNRITTELLLESLQQFRLNLLFAAASFSTAIVSAHLLYSVFCFKNKLSHFLSSGPLPENARSGNSPYLKKQPVKIKIRRRGSKGGIRCVPGPVFKWDLSH